MKVLALARYGRLGSSSRVRMYQYIPYLKQQGIHITVEALLDDAYLVGLYSGKANQITSRVTPYLKRWLHLRNRRTFDLLWVQNELFPWLPEPLESMGRGSDIPWIIDYDDAWFHRYNLHANPIVRFSLGKKIDHLMRMADSVVVGSHYLYDHAASLRSKHVVHVPSAVDTARYTVAEKKNSPFTIGWIGNPQTAAYIKPFQRMLDRFCAKTGSRLTLVGAGTYDAGPYGCVRPWKEETEVAEIHSFNVGIMPLPDSPWERGKCGYKLIQYMACGKPVIASPVGENRSIVEHMVNGYLVETEDQWYDALSSLYSTPSQAADMGSASRKKVEAEYSLSITAPMLLEAMMETCGSSPQPVVSSR